MSRPSAGRRENENRLSFQELWAVIRAGKFRPPTGMTVKHGGLNVVQTLRPHNRAAAEPA